MTLAVIFFREAKLFLRLFHYNILPGKTPLQVRSQEGVVLPGKILCLIQ